MANTEASKLAARIREALEAREQADGQDIEAFLTERLGPEDARAVLATLRAIKANHDEIEASEDDRQVWLARVLHDARQHVPEETEVRLPDSTSTLAIPAALARDVDEGLTRALAAGLENAPLGKSEAEVLSARDFFTRELGHSDDLETIATVTAAVLPALREDDPEVSTPAVAAAVDIGANAAKAAYHVAAGRVDRHEAAGWVLDRVAAAAGEAIQRAIPELAAHGGQLLGQFLGGLIGAAPVGAMVGRQLGQLAGQAIAEPLGRGVKALVKSIPALAVKAYEAVKKRVLAFLGV